jgi:hypothetical protein
MSHMDHFAPGTDEDPRRTDLASLVLADERARRSHERRGRGGGGAFLARSGLSDGYDARSVLVLALVVASLAAVIGWTMTVGVGDPAPPSHASNGAAGAAPAAATNTTAPTASTHATVPARHGIDLRVNQVTTARSDAGGGVIRVSVRNAGTVDGDASLGTQLVVLLDGAVVGERSLGGIAANSSATTEVGLDTCPSGRHSIAVIVDPRSAIREFDEADNARTSVASFGC